jgi:hypothetical protein
MTATTKRATVHVLRSFGRRRPEIIDYEFVGEMRQKTKVVAKVGSKADVSKWVSM